MQYREQLQTEEWKSKRLSIFSRDNYKCTSCGLPRPKFLGLSKRFGILSYDELSKYGAIWNIDNEKETITFIYLNHLGVAKFWPIIEHFAFVPEALDIVMQTRDGIPDYYCVPKDSIQKKDILPDLNAHHKYYIKGRSAWDYNNDALITLCVSCHKLEHKQKNIPVYSEMGTKLYEACSCDKCSGSGYSGEYEICDQCFGHGINFK